MINFYSELMCNLVLHTATALQRGCLQAGQQMGEEFPKMESQY